METKEDKTGGLKKAYKSLYLRKIIVCAAIILLHIFTLFIPYFKVTAADVLKMYTNQIYSVCQSESLMKTFSETYDSDFVKSTAEKYNALITSACFDGDTDSVEYKEFATSFTVYTINVLVKCF